MALSHGLVYLFLSTRDLYMVFYGTTIVLITKGECVMDDIYGKLNECIGKHLDELMELDVGSDEMSKAVDDTAVLYKLRIEEEKVKIERARAVAEKSEKDNHRTLDKKKLIIDTIIGATEIVLPLTLYGVLSYIGFAREFDGVVSSDTLKRVLNSIKTKR